MELLDVVFIRLLHVEQTLLKNLLQLFGLIKFLILRKFFWKGGKSIKFFEFGDILIDLNSHFGSCFSWTFRLSGHSQVSIEVTGALCDWSVATSWGARLGLGHGYLLVLL